MTPCIHIPNQVKQALTTYPTTLTLPHESHRATPAARRKERHPMSQARSNTTSTPPPLSEAPRAQSPEPRARQQSQSHMISSINHTRTHPSRRQNPNPSNTTRVKWNSGMPSALEQEQARRERAVHSLVCARGSGAGRAEM